MHEFCIDLAQTIYALDSTTIDVHLPTTDGRHIVMSRYTQPEKDVSLLLAQLGLTLPEQPPPKCLCIGTGRSVVPTFFHDPLIFLAQRVAYPSNCESRVSVE